MKKQLLLMAVVIAAVLFFTACQAEPTPIGPTPTPLSVTELELAEPLQTYPELESYVSMTLSGPRSNSAAVTIRNESGFPLAIDLPHHTLEVYDSGQWRRVPMNDSWAFPSIFLGVDPYGSARFDIDLSAFPLGAGLYRIRKSVMIDRAQALNTLHDLVVEFYWDE